MDNIIEEIRKYKICEFRINEPLSRHTTWKVGGPADLLVYPNNREQLIQILKAVYRYDMSWRVIGRGSNLLVRDGGIRGVVIKLDEGFNHFRIDGTKVIVGGSYSTIRLASMTVKHGLIGLEFASGIPGNVGGAVYMNAGAHGSEISRVLTSAEVILENGEYIILNNKDLNFSYRTSILQKELRGIVTGATFKLLEDSQKKAVTMLANFKEYRRNTQPLQFPCAGSVFRNPPGDYAGRLIQELGLKGYRIGDAEISLLHANFIVNRGNATAKDILDLIKHVIEAVQGKYGIILETEILVVGE